MYTKIICFIVSASVVLAQHPPVAQFPAGVDPALCPSYPNCDNAYLHNPQQQQQNQWNQPQPQWNQPQQNQWNQPQQNQWNQPQQNQWNQPQQNGQWDESQNNDWTQWDEPQQQQWNAPAQQNAWNAPAVRGPSSNALPAGDKYPAGVNPQSCPNYPYCDNANLAGGHGAPQVAPLPGWTERVYPAGVSAHSCPNYPLCN